MSAPETNWRCETCGHEQYAEITETTMDISFLVFCVGCGMSMTRMDPLGEIESSLRRPRHWNELFEEAS